MKSIKETYTTSTVDSDSEAWVGMGVVATIVVTIWIGLWVWNLIAIIKYWDVIPVWAQIIGILGLLPSVGIGNIISLIVIYVARGSSTRRKSRSTRRKSRSRR